MVVHYDEGICSLSLSEARRLLSAEAHSKALIPQYGRSILQRSLRTADRAEAVRLSSQIVAALHREWQELLFALPQDGSSIYEGLITGPKQELSLSEAMHLYVQATGKEGNQRFIASSERSVAEGDISVR